MSFRFAVSRIVKYPGGQTKFAVVDSEGTVIVEPVSDAELAASICQVANLAFKMGYDTAVWDMGIEEVAK